MLFKDDGVFINYDTLIGVLLDRRRSCPSLIGFSQIWL